MGAALLAVLALTSQARAGAFSNSAHGNPAKLPYGCGTCHVGHGPPRTTMLPDVQEVTCFACHGSALAQSSTWTRRMIKGSTTLANISTEFLKLSHHPLSTLGSNARTRIGPVVTSAPAATAATGVTCSDCHDPHYMVKADRSDTLTRIRQIGSARGKTQAEYQLCYRCHGTGAAVDIQRLTRSSNPSFHPVEAIGRSTDVPSLTQPYTVQSLIACTSCHGSEQPNGPRGPHGSAFSPILKANFSKVDGLPESINQYDLCYRCHNRDILLNDASFSKHHLHLGTTVRASCFACHNSHGSSLYPHLISFDPAIVRGNSKGVLRYQQTGMRHGTCDLLCHGEDHVNRKY